MRLGLACCVASLLFACGSFFGTHCYAQTTDATVTGELTDQSGKVVPGVTILFTNINTGIPYSGQSNGSGIYTLLGLPPGIYRANVTRDGFKSVVKSDIELHVQDQVSINFNLQVGSVSETITVEAGAPMIDTQSAAVSTVIDRQFVENLPLNGRSFDTLLQLTPGVVQGPNGFNVNGQRDQENYYTVDGVSANFGVGSTNLYTAGQKPAVTSFGGTNSLLSIDALQEFRIQTSSFAPEYGRTPGGQVEVTTRSGTNAFHGSLFDYFRNDALDANDWFYDQAVGQAPAGTIIPKPALRQNDFGGVFGGPVLKDKTFFFVSYEGLRLVQPEVQLLSVPNSQTRQSIAAPLNQLVNEFPQPNGNDLGNGFSAFTQTTSARQQLDVGSVRIDHSINTNVSIFGRASFADSSSQVPLYNNVTFANYPTRFVTLGLNAQMNPHLTDQFRFNYSMSKSDTDNGLIGSPSLIGPVKSLLLPAPFTQNGFSFFDLFSNDFSSFADIVVGSGLHESVEQFNLVDDLSYTVAAHVFKFGADFRALKLGNLPNPSALDYFPTISDLMAGGFSAGEADLNSPSHLSDFNWSFYAQDTWKVGHKTVITYGLRWDINTAPKGTDGTLFIVPQNINDPANLTAGPSKQLGNTRYGNFAPRIGIAFSPSTRITLRSAFGLFYDLGTNNVGATASNYPFNNYNPIGSFTALPLTNPAQYQPASPLTPPFNNAAYMFLIDPNLRLPYSLQWNFGAEVSATHEDTIGVTYVGQAGRHLLRVEKLNNPNANFGTVEITENGSISNYNALQLQYRHRFAHGLQVLANYTWSHSLDDASANLANEGPFSLLDLTREYSNSAFDVRHDVSVAITYDLPTPSRAKALRTVLGGWGIDTILYARTGFPIDVTQNDPSNQFIALGESRPDRVPGQPFWVADPTAPDGQRVNAKAFAIRPPNQQGDLPRDAVPGYGYTQWDASLRRRFSLSENWKLLLRLDLFNTLNHPNFGNPQVNFSSGSATDPQFGVATQMLNQALPGLSSIYQNGGPRSLQISLKVQF